MNTKEIQAAVAKDRVLSGHTCVVENISYSYLHEMDVMSVTKNGYMCEYEVKISRSDFLADKKKKKQLWFKLKAEDRIPNYFFYVVPEGLVSENEIPDYAGLYYVINGELNLVRYAKIIHKRKHDINKIQQKVIRLFEQRVYLGGCLLTYLNRQIRERNERTINEDLLLSNSEPAAQESDTTNDK